MLLEVASSSACACAVASTPCDRARCPCSPAYRPANRPALGTTRRICTSASIASSAPSSERNRARLPSSLSHGVGGDLHRKGRPGVVKPTREHAVAVYEGDRRPQLARHPPGAAPATRQQPHPRAERDHLRSFGRSARPGGRSIRSNCARARRAPRGVSLDGRPDALVLDRHQHRPRARVAKAAQPCSPSRREAAGSRRVPALCLRA